MSYDISFKVKVQDKPVYVELDVGSANITWNVKELIRQSSGWSIKNCKLNEPVQEWIEFIKRGIHELETNPDKYRQYEGSNGWGTVEGTLDFYRNCMEMYAELIECYEELADVSYVYVD